VTLVKALRITRVMVPPLALVTSLVGDRVRGQVWLHLLVLVMSHRPIHQLVFHQLHLVRVRVDHFIHPLLLVNPLQSVPPRVRAHRLSQVLALRLNLIAKQGLLLEALQVTQARVPL